MINISNKDRCVDNKVVNHQNYLVEENRLHFVVDSGRGTTIRTASIFDTLSRTAWYGSRNMNFPVRDGGLANIDNCSGLYSILEDIK
jgi:hypothetical protein